MNENTLKQHPRCQRCGRDLASSLDSTATHVFDETRSSPEKNKIEADSNTIADTITKISHFSQESKDDFDLDRTVESPVVSSEATSPDLRLPKEKPDIALSSITQGDTITASFVISPEQNTDPNAHSRFGDAQESRITLDLKTEELFQNQATHAERLLNADPSYRIARAKKAREQAGDNASLSSNEYVYGIHRLVRNHVKGGMGMVHIAYDQFLKREVALKELFRESTADESIVHRFIVEAEITAQLEHPGIIPIHSLGLDLNGNPYYTMKFIRGRTLQEAIKMYFKDPNEAELKRLIRRFVSVCKTMAFAHQKGVIHRDLKPANIMLSEHGETLVMDWGIAKVYDPESATGAGGTSLTLSEPTRGNSSIRPTTRSGSQTLDLTMAGTVVGTPAFMSPEQASPDSNFVGPLSDVFSLGAILFYLLTGRNAYTGRSSQEVLTKVLTTNPPKPSDVARNIPPGLEAICLKAMSRNQKDRYQSATELDVDLCSWLDGEPISAMKEKFTEKLWRYSRKNRQMSIGVFFALMFFFIVLTVLIVALDRRHRDTHSHSAESQAITQRIEQIEKKILPDLELEARETKKLCEEYRRQLDSATIKELKDGHQKQLNIQLKKAAELDEKINNLMQVRKELRALNQSIKQGE